jgi:hypothetical protein
MRPAPASSQPTTDHLGTSSKAAILVTVLCWLTVVADGFDLIV